MSTALARKFRVDVTTDLNLDRTAAVGYLQLNGIDDFKDSITPNLEDSSAYDTNGWATSEITMNEWSATATFFRRLTAGAYDPAQELLRACRGKTDAAARAGIRWYDKNGGPEAYSGIAVVGWERASTGVKDLDKVTVTFTGTDIPLNLALTNPAAGGAAIPTIASATPTGQGAGKIVQLVGSGFLGLTAATAVTVGGTNASSYVAASDAQLSLVLPAGTAGTTPIVVTNAAGASSAFVYTRAV